MSIEKKFTAGPWDILPEEVDRQYIRIRGTILGGRYKVCNVLTTTYEGIGEREAKETRSNANLISAAPELLEALEGMIHWYGNRGYDNVMLHANEQSSEIELAISAIKKAYGEQS